MVEVGEVGEVGELVNWWINEIRNKLFNVYLFTRLLVYLFTCLLVYFFGVTKVKCRK